MTKQELRMESLERANKEWAESWAIAETALKQAIELAGIRINFGGELTACMGNADPKDMPELADAVRKVQK